MKHSYKTRVVVLVFISSLLNACGGLNSNSRDTNNGEIGRDPSLEQDGSRFRDLFKPNGPETEVLVNKYIWSAAIEVLDFLPIQTIDPFTGVIVTGYGTPPSGGRAYRATVLIKDPALDARSLNVALQTRSGPAAASTTRAIEDAILSRARQLRIADNKL